jgi:Ca-activated chloride channel homolog
MRRSVPVLMLLLASAPTARANGLLIPEEKNIPPLAMVNHRVTITLEDQVAVTHVEQVFRNHTDRQLEATYVFPVPRGAGVERFTMCVNGREVRGELVEADKARRTYEDIVRRTQDPGLLEYLGNNLLRLRVFPVLPRSDQRVAVTYTAVATRDAGLVEYIYPLKTDGKAVGTLEDFSIQATIRSQQPLQNIYSPTHLITVTRPNDHEALVKFDRNQGLLDKDFQLFCATGDKDIGFTPLLHRPLSGEKGYFLLLISPRLETPREQVIPRDMVFVLDTSGSMQGPKMDQARRALKFCLNNLTPRDRFGLINFATTVNRYRDRLLDTTREQVEQASKWVDNLEATGGTAINDALAAALEMRDNDAGRTFTIVFFTDGQPTVGETNIERITHNVLERNTASTRIFTFGVGDDVNATFLDQLAERTRAVTTYVKPAEDIEAKVRSLYSKISHPVLADLKLAAEGGVRLEEIYPPQLPDLFQGSQLVVLGRYSGQGHAALRLQGSVGKEPREFVYEVNFADRTKDEKGFVEQLWARRKVGYLLDEIRAHGENKELVQEVVSLAKKYGIATPYTSYLIVPDAPVPVAGLGRNGRTGMMMGSMAGAGVGGFGGPAFRGAALPPQSAPAAPRLLDVAEALQRGQDGLAGKRSLVEEQKALALKGAVSKDDKGVNGYYFRAAQEAAARKSVYDRARAALGQGRPEEVQAGALGVDLSIDAAKLRSQSRLTQTAVRRVAGRDCLEIGGIWIDQGFKAKMPALVVKAMSDAYFRLLDRHPQLKEVLQLGNHVVWVTPNGTALVIDTADGKEKLADADMDALFVPGK